VGFKGFRVAALNAWCHDIPLFKGSVAGLPLICTEAEHKGIRLWAGPTSKIASFNHQYNLFKLHVHALPVNLDILAIDTHLQAPRVVIYTESTHILNFQASFSAIRL
jgi:hypothetical protein